MPLRTAQAGKTRDHGEKHHGQEPRHPEMESPQEGVFAMRARESVHLKLNKQDRQAREESYPAHRPAVCGEHAALPCGELLAYLPDLPHPPKNVKQDKPREHLKSHCDPLCPLFVRRKESIMYPDPFHTPGGYVFGLKRLLLLPKALILKLPPAHLERIGHVCAALAVAGPFVPFLPGPPFGVLAVWLYKQANSPLYQKVRYHPLLVGPLDNWERDRSIAPKAKYSALCMMTLGVPLSLLLLPYLVMQLAVAALALAAALYILSRPSPPTD